MLLKVVLQESGEHVLITAGEVHLQRCLQDLREHYAQIEINASQPIVPFRETIVSPLENPVKDNMGSVSITTPGKRFSLQLRAVSLPEEVVSLLEKNVDIIKIMRQARSGADKLETPMEEVDDAVRSKMESSFTKLRNQLDEAFQKVKWGSDAADRILSFGPRHCGPNLLINKSSTTLSSIWTANPADKTERSVLECLSSIINGFQLATLAGPLCEEPLLGVAFLVEELTIIVDSSISVTEDQEGFDVHQQSASLSGQIISAVKEGCRRAFQTQPQRLMAAMYSCSIQVSGEVVGTPFS